MPGGKDRCRAAVAGAAQPGASVHRTPKGRLLPEQAVCERKGPPPRSPHLPTGLPGPGVEYRLKGIEGTEGLYRLVTTVTDSDRAPAAELAALYHVPNGGNCSAPLTAS